MLGSTLRLSHAEMWGIAVVILVGAWLALALHLAWPPVRVEPVEEEDWSWPRWEGSE